MKKILLIDDQRKPRFIKDPDDTENYGYYKDNQVEVAINGEIGIEKLKSQKWDLLLLDHDLGYDCLTGMGVLNFLEINREYMPKKIYLVTANYTSGALMAKIIKQWKQEGLIEDSFWIN
jgi:hypothetical protein